MSKIGPTFHAELVAAGLSGLSIAWDENDFSYGDDLTETQIAALAAVVAAHDPNKPTAPDRVTRRQFLMQLEIDGIYDAVTDWVAAQPRLVQIAFGESGTFVRADPMLQQGFAGMGFSPDRVDEFFTAASQLI